MKKLTTKQRNSIYKKAYIASFERYDEGLYICEAFSNVIPNTFWGNYYTEQWEETLPEFAQFNPNYCSSWWGWYNNPVAKDERLTALAFMIAMTE